MEVAGFAAVGDPANVVDGAIVARRYLVGIFDDLINEITEVENETELIGGRRALIFKDHPAIGIELAFIHALTTDKGEIDGSWIVRRGRGDRPADAATVPLCIGETVPVDAGRFEMTDQHARRPIRFRRDGRGRFGDDAAEGIIL